MGLTVAFIQALIKALIFGFLAFLGIIAGKKFRDKKDANKSK